MLQYISCYIIYSRLYFSPFCYFSTFDMHFSTSYYSCICPCIFLPYYHLLLSVAVIVCVVQYGCWVCVESWLNPLSTASVLKGWAASVLLSCHNVFVNMHVVRVFWVWGWYFFFLSLNTYLSLSIWYTIHNSSMHTYVCILWASTSLKATLSKFFAEPHLAGLWLLRVHNSGCHNICFCWFRPPNVRSGQ